MGVDLILLPVDTEEADGTLICSRWFYLDMRCVVDRFLDIERYPVVGKVYWPIESIPAPLGALLPPNLPWPNGHPIMFGMATVSPITYVLAKDVRQSFVSNPQALDDVNDFEIAAIAYVSSLYDTTKVLLYWC